MDEGSFSLEALFGAEPEANRAMPAL
jgi:hypothetical protein